MLRLLSECRSGTAGLAEEASSVTHRLGEACPIDPARGTDQVRTCRPQEGFSILEQEIFVLGNETLEFLTFSRGQTPPVVLVEQPVKPCLALDIEPLQLN